MRYLRVHPALRRSVRLFLRPGDPSVFVGSHSVRTYTEPVSFSFVVAKVGLEPTRPYGQQILSLPGLPIPPFGHAVKLGSGCRTRTYTSFDTSS